MKILMISGSPIMGGAEIAARRLAVGLARAGHQIFYFGILPDSIQEPGVRHYTLNTGPIYGRFLKSLRYFSYPISYRLNTKFAIRSIRTIIQEEKPDVINIHVIKQAFWSPDLIAYCAEQAPTVWTLHEMSSFTGRCVHALSCTKYISGCDESCPSMHIPLVIPRSLTRKRWIHHQRVLQEHPGIVAVCPSQWLADRACESLWKDHRVEVIPHGIDTSEFSPIMQNQARKQFGLPTDLTLILIAAVDIKSPIKGGKILQEALKLMKPGKFGIVTMGCRGLPSMNDLDIPVFNLGYVAHTMLSDVYSAVDLLVHPSLAESFGLVVIEANACGTPVLAFAHTALQEIIEDGVNGYLVSPCNARALAERLEEVIESSWLYDKNTHNNSREKAKNLYFISYQVKRYLSIFEEITASNVPQI